ncbi:TadE/TadG family type IV pilus assembly protein [Zavarzinia sp.]|uniref:TadE/TadG family type IV pilus assembly protein n=1 Tax=Zavarzinia sp. TaxID=2027920 RepID=UPI003BB5E89B|nr:pilus assembly protein [Zavarzinia sp.]
MGARRMIDGAASPQGNGGERGATLIEFALISSLMFAMLFGVLSFGEILADRVQLRHRLSEISRLVSLGEDATDRQQIFNDIKDDRMSGFMNMSGCSPQFTADSFAGPNITITASYQFRPDGSCRVMPEIFVGILPDHITMTGSFTVTD